MTAATTGGGSRDTGDVHALITDRYLDSILAAHARGADSGPVPVDADPDPLVRFAAERLGRDLPRLYPSFRFEEALAARLGEAAARVRLPLAAGSESVIVPLRDLGSPPARPPAPPGATLGGDRIGLHPVGRPTIARPLLIGGALTSAALSIAGAAWLAWRIRRAPQSPMARAVRAVARTRLA